AFYYIAFGLIFFSPILFSENSFKETACSLGGFLGIFCRIHDFSLPFRTDSRAFFDPLEQTLPKRFKKRIRMGSCVIDPACMVLAICIWIAVINDETICQKGGYFHRSLFAFLGSG